MSSNPTHKSEWKNLEKLSKEGVNLNDLFTENPKRFDDYSINLNGLFFDYSKQQITSEILENLIALAQKSGVKESRDALFDGDKINITENRAVLHTALRSSSDNKIEVDNHDIIPEIHETLKSIENLSNKIRAGEYLGTTGKPITQIISIGIGGSDLGPRMAYQALNNEPQPVSVSFVSNIDTDDINQTLAKCDPETSLFIVISKSFSTQETLMNAAIARKWLEKSLSNQDISNHFIAVSSNIEAAVKFSINPENIYPMWDWINGRFSLCSAVGLPLAIGVGFDAFSDLLRGASTMDEHFKTAPMDQNMPVLMALIAIWNRNFLQNPHLAVLPYAQRLTLFPNYLQQLEMESNGKSTDLEGHSIVDYETGTIIFGEAGTNGQHSFYQLFHQGCETIPCDFIGIIKPKDNSNIGHHNVLMANMLAQSQAMMQGKTCSENPHKHVEGNKPSTTLLLNKLDAYHLGMLIALYEHKVMVQGVIWNINSFDQFGVELGKTMAKNIENHDLSSLDPSTLGLYSLIHKDNK
jgi:glucose-6-phosphate isomerase